jgi:rRNA-processing protein FCF1
MILNGQHPTTTIHPAIVEELRVLSKEERKAKREAEKLRPKRKYVKKADRPKGIKIVLEPVVLTFD